MRIWFERTRILRNLWEFNASLFVNRVSSFVLNALSKNVTRKKKKEKKRIDSLRCRHISGHCGGLVAERVYLPE